MSDKIVTYREKPFESLNRGELIELLSHLQDVSDTAWCSTEDMKKNVAGMRQVIARMAEL